MVERRGTSVRSASKQLTAVRATLRGRPPQDSVSVRQITPHRNTSPSRTFLIQLWREEQAGRKFHRIHRNRERVVRRTGHYCRICHTFRPNEVFSGKGHRIHVCRDCRRLPRAEREYIEVMDELFGYLEQRNISAGNVKRLGILTTHARPEIRNRSLALLELAAVKPHKRRRWKYLRRQRPDLLERLKVLFCGSDVRPPLICMPMDVLSDQPTAMDIKYIPPLDDNGVPPPYQEEEWPGDDYRVWD